jgi:YD repeat-containing protein
MKKLSDTLTELGIYFSFPIQIKDANYNRTYYEDRDGYWDKCEYNANGELTYYKNSNGIWRKYGYDANGNETYYEDSKGYWSKTEYDANGNWTHYENSNGDIEGTPRSQSCNGKVIEIDGKRYKLTEL